jgi:cytochrome P450
MASNPDSQELVSWPPPRSCPFQPPPPYKELRDRDPLSRVRLNDGTVAWLITRHAYTRQLLTDSRLSSDRTHPDYPELAPGQKTVNTQGFLSWLDGEEHASHRRLAIGDFTLHRLAQMRPRIQEITDNAIGNMLEQEPPVDLVRALSLPVPSLVICELLGVPYEERRFFQERTVVITDRYRSGQDRLTSAAELRSYLGGLVAIKEREPADDMISHLIAKYRKVGTYDPGHTAGLALQILLAGHETTANMISLGTVAMLQNPALLAEMLSSPEATRLAVEELLRYCSVSDLPTTRVALADITIGGHTIKAGEGVCLPTSAANWDPEVFEHPERLDFSRDARQHVAFGYGAHQCLGQNLTRLELSIVYPALFTSVPTLRLAVPFEELPFKEEGNITYGLHEVQVAW